MKWLIVAPEVRDRDVGKAETFFESEGWDYEEVFVSGNLTCSQISEIAEQAACCTHCIVLNADYICCYDDFIFILGLAAGKEMMTLIHGNDETVKRYAVSSVSSGIFLKQFPSADALVAYLQEAAPAVAAEDIRRQNLASLFKEGIPFTADSYLYYLEKEKPQICSMILAAGMDVNAFSSEGVPLLCAAVRAENEEQIDILLKGGADINAVSKDRGYTPVMDAVWRKNYRIAQLLIERGADLGTMSSDGQSILVLAVGNGNSRIVKLLLDSGADPDIKDSMGMSAREYASLFKNEELMKLMERIPQKEEQ